MVTMSTVGYGDIACTTSIGRFFQILFLGVGLVSAPSFPAYHCLLRSGRQSCVTRMNHVEETE